MPKRKNLTKCWLCAGRVHIVVEEDPDLGVGLRVVDISSGEMYSGVYQNMEELIEGEGLDEDEIFGVDFKRSKFGGVEVTAYNI